MRRIIHSAVTCGLIVLALLADTPDAVAGHCGSPPSAWGRSGSSAYASWCRCMGGSYDYRTTTCSGATHGNRRPPPPPPPPTPEELSNRSFNHGNDLSDRGDDDGAIKAYLTALKLNPRNANAMNNLALVYGRKGWYRKGIDLLRRAMKIRPHPGYRRNLINQMDKLGDRLFDQKKYAEAEKWFRSILGMDPNNASALNELGRIASARGEHGLALEYYRRAVLADPSADYARKNLAQKREYLEQRNRNRAIDQAITGAERAERQGRPADAVRHYRELLRLRPNDSGARRNLARALAKMGNLSEAEAEYRKLVGGQWSENEVEDLIANMYRKDASRRAERAEGDEKLDIWTEFLRRYPGRRGNSIRSDMALYAAKQERYGAAQQLFADILRHDPDNANAKHNLAWAKAKVAWAERKRFQKTAKAAEENGDAANAEKAFIDMARVDPANPFAANELGRFYLRQGRVDEAVVAFRIGASRNPGDAALLHNFALALKRAGQWEEAEKVAAKALKIRPDDALTKELFDDVHGHNTSIFRNLDVVTDAVDKAGTVVTESVSDAVDSVVDTTKAWVGAFAGARRGSDISGGGAMKQLKALGFWAETAPRAPLDHLIPGVDGAKTVSNRIWDGSGMVQVGDGPEVAAPDGVPVVAIKAPMKNVTIAPPKGIESFEPMRRVRAQQKALERERTNQVRKVEELKAAHANARTPTEARELAVEVVNAKQDLAGTEQAIAAVKFQGEKVKQEFVSFKLDLSTKAIEPGGDQEDSDPVGGEAPPLGAEQRR